MSLVCTSSVVAAGTASRAAVAVVPFAPALRPTSYAAALVVVVAVLIALGLLTLARRRRGTPSSIRFVGAAIFILLAGVSIALVVPRSRGRERPSDELDSVPDTTPESVVATDGAVDWPTDRGSFRRLGYLPPDSPPSSPRVVWRRGKDGETFYGSPACDGPRIYAVGSTGDRGRIYALDAATGRVVWTASPPGYRATFSSPVLRAGRLYCGEGLHHTTRARLVCLDAAPTFAGDRLRWMFEVDSHLESTPTATEDAVYFGAGDDGVYGLDVSGEAREPRPVWRLPGRDFPDAESGVAMDDQFVYAGLGIGGQALVAVDRRDGREAGRLWFPYPVFGVPSIADGKLYVGMGEGDYLTPDKSQAGQIVCVDLAAWRIAWTLPLPASVLGAVAVADGELVWCGSNGAIGAATLDGRPLRSFEAGAPIAGGPAVTPTTIYAATFAGRLVALDRATFRPKWTLTIAEPGPLTGSPIAVGGRIYVGTHRDGLVCVGAADESTAAESPVDAASADRSPAETGAGEDR